jgi:phenylpropionate dioxygenase-like ring-hydroxylating dioxygenase large terminal subunit
MQPNDSELFDPRHYAKVRLPLLEAETMPPWTYTSEAFYKREVDRIFMKVWNFLGHVDQVKKPGDYFALDFAGVPLIILRDEAGEVRAFANSCRHRGSALLSGSGNCKSIICPYHSWTYALNGRLVGAPDMGQTQGFRNEDNGLIPLRLETWGGFIFVNFDQNAAPLGDYLGDLKERIAPYQLEDMELVRRREYVMECNWKLFVENAKESYHIGTVHKSTINKYASVRKANYQVEKTDGEYCTTFTTHEGSMALLQGDIGFPAIESLAGKRQEGGTSAPLIYPSTYLACTIDCAWYLELHPLGPTRTRLIHGCLFPRSRRELPDYEARAANYYKRWDLTTDEDIQASERQQKGIGSPFCKAGRFSYREPLVHVIDNWILDRVLS